MHTWHWQTWNDRPYLTCSLLEAWPHGFFTQLFAPMGPTDLTPILCPTAHSFQVKQVHGNRVLTTSELEAAVAIVADQPSITWPDADGIVAELADQAVWVCSADCTPVLIGDESTGLVAAVHAGWRGTSQKILPQAIVRLQDLGSQLQHLRIAMGPAIAGEVYQVSETVAAQVGASIVPHEATEISTVLSALWQLEKSPLVADSEPGRVRLDVRRVNALQLEQLGISSEQVAIAPYCTYQDPVHFFSYRRNPEKKAQWSGIASRFPTEKQGHPNASLATPTCAES